MLQMSNVWCFTSTPNLLSSLRFIPETLIKFILGGMKTASENYLFLAYLVLSTWNKGGDHDSERPPISESPRCRDVP